MKKNKKQAAVEAAETAQPEEELTPIETLQPGELAMVALNRLFRSSYNPRKRFDEDSLKRLAQSIQEKGIIEPLVVRQVTNQNASGYEVVAGERRFRAAQMVIAPEDTLPVIIRDLTDKQALEIAVIENVEREDIDPIEEAGAYKALADSGYTQAEIAARVHRDRSVIANRMRLLELPETILAMISAGSLSPTHGIHLVRYAKFPEVVEEIATLIVRGQISVSDLSDSLPGAWQLGQKGLIRQFSYGDEFEKSECKSCPFGAYIKYQRGATVCLKPDHYEELKAKQNAEANAAREKALAKAQAQLDEQRSAKPQAGAETGPVDAPASETGKGKKAKKESAKPKISNEKAVDITKLGYNEYRSLQYSKPPPGCDENCPCRCLGVDRDGDIIPICLQPRRMQNLCNAQEKDRRGDLQEKYGEQRERTWKRWEKAGRGLSGKAALIALMWPALREADVPDVKEAMISEKVTLTVDLSKLFGKGLYNIPQDQISAFFSELMAYDFERVLRFGLRILTNCDIKSAARYGNNAKLPVVDWLIVALKEVPHEPIADLSVPAAAGEEDSDESWQAMGGDLKPVPQEAPSQPAQPKDPESNFACGSCGAKIDEAQFDLSCDQADDGNARCPKCLGEYLDAKTQAVDEPPVEEQPGPLNDGEQEAEEATF